MGKSTLSKLPASPVQTPSTPEQYNALVDVSEGVQVMRDTNGVEADGLFDIGEIANGRPNYVHVKNGFTVGGKVLNTTPYLLTNTSLNSGKSKTSGYPNFLQAGGTGNAYFKILGSSTPLETVIDGITYTLRVDLTSDDLVLAPSSNNTCLVNDIYLAAQSWTRCIGEYGLVLNIDTVGSEITALNGKIAAFKLTHGAADEIFLAYVDTTNTHIRPIWRGLGSTGDVYGVRLPVSNDDVLTLLNVAYIFLGSDLVTINITYNYPIWSSPAPVTPSAGDYWFSMDDEIWYVYSGGEWIADNSVYLGMAFCDSTACLWVEPAMYDYNWDSFLSFKTMYSIQNICSIEGPIEISVSGKLIEIRGDFKNINHSTNLIPGETLLLPGWFYVYVSSNGTLFSSMQPPRKPDKRKGWYHPTENYRAICCFYVGGAGTYAVSRYSLNSGKIDIEDGVIGMSTDPGNGSYVVSGINMPEIVEQATLQVIYHGTSGTLGMKLLDLISDYPGVTSHLEQIVDYHNTLTGDVFFSAQVPVTCSNINWQMYGTATSKGVSVKNIMAIFIRF